MRAAGRGQRDRTDPHGRHSPGRHPRPLCRGDLRAENFPEIPRGLKVALRAAGPSWCGPLFPVEGALCLPLWFLHCLCGITAVAPNACLGRVACFSFVVTPNPPGESKQAEWE